MITKFWSLFNHRKAKQLIRNKFKEIKVYQRKEHILIEGDREQINKVIQYVRDKERLIIKSEIIDDYLKLRG